MGSPAVDYAGERWVTCAMRSRSVTLRLLMVLCASAALSVVAAPPAWSATVVRTSGRMEFAPGELVTDATCTGEVVYLGGFIQYHFVTVLGTPFHTTGDFKSVLHGVGETTGKQYVSLQMAHASYTSNGLAPYTATNVWRQRLISQGSADDFVVTMTAHITVTPAGETTVTFYNTETACV
jgi:hypothetical protein